MDEIASRIDEEVIMQIGATDYTPAHARYFRYIDDDAMVEFIQQARLVISHAGAGTLLTLSSVGRSAILVPRLKQYGEAIDDHQLELAEVMAKDGAMTVIREVNDLDACVQNANFCSHMLVKNHQFIRELRQIVNSFSPPAEPRGENR
jgi:UDP-N-acetylglucosamine transferase subunit ALG13